MAWISMVAGLMYPLLLWVSDSDQLGAVAGPFYIFVGAVVGAYVGFSTVEDMNSDKLSSYSRGRYRDDRDREAY
jgi:hypothetical protein